MSRRKNWITPVALFVCTVILFVLPQARAGENNTAQIVPGHFHFRTFQGPSEFVLSVEDINNFGTVVGSYELGTVSSPGPFRGFELTPFGKQLTLVDPRDQQLSTDPDGGFTQVYGLNDLGVIVGEYYNSAAGHYAGFFLFNGKYTTFNVPGYFNTGVYGISNSYDFVGLVQTGAPDFFSSAFISDHGKITTFTIPGATYTQAAAINNLGEVLGYYFDTNNVVHAFLRDRKGKLTYPIDVPGVTTASGLGTVPLGINDFGAISGHFWDASLAEHGFVRTASGRFYQIDVPNASATSGGGLNNFGVVVGHYNDQSGNQFGYIAIPDCDLE